MAILDKENRPRGLRVPSFTRKGFKQKSSESLPQKEVLQNQVPAQPDAVPAPPTFNIPSQPQDGHIPNPNPSMANIHPAYRAYRPQPQPPAVPAAVPAAVQPTPPSSEEDPERMLQPRDAEEPLEDFIPTPEPELDGTATPMELVSSEENNGPWTPPEIEPVAAPLNKLHFACYQDHKSMPPANNVWHALPCMTCQKFDREVRYRCVFCCLRICAGCFQTLQKSPDRSLAQLMESISTPAA
ncbi:hypothetical protein BO70DRAFT_365193 [Aspergillus heteromorphus CBS 117.55]|uniref:Uncharacterized protein n=1 Tax=Aspergillus heteromorphus CBS 117.55 TaxID=1448321 RepID=A0A317VBQ9_9EURO|nr:uncharacterized protein BO70DRAFT_365193 [Aspergillus heteromorphus CBS 117.55]PWY71465.1 hypothetical protein BO70DRAFT_365193 [Aspergillus heteromorphus CBS 117.55]